MTPFSVIVNKFLGKITDDMYLELTPEDTMRDAKQILLDAIPYFEFPRFPLYNFDEEKETYNINLTDEEINILALLMKTAWLERQINSVEVTRMKYSSSDFKFTSQANHLSKLLSLKSENTREAQHAQRLYKRRRFSDVCGNVESNWAVFNSGVYYESTKESSSSSNGCNCGNSQWEPMKEEDKNEPESEWIPIH
jgi:hypothetical protein